MHFYLLRSKEEEEDEELIMNFSFLSNKVLFKIFLLVVQRDSRANKVYFDIKMPGHQ